MLSKQQVRHYYHDTSLTTGNLSYIGNSIFLLESESCVHHAGVRRLSPLNVSSPKY
jgi:hypothetical protein